jgi:hypothetical protein
MQKNMCLSSRDMAVQKFVFCDGLSEHVAVAFFPFKFAIVCWFAFMNAI